MQCHRKEFLVGGAQFEATYRIVSNLFMKTWGEGTCPPPRSYAYVKGSTEC